VFASRVTRLLLICLTILLVGAPAVEASRKATSRETRQIREATSIALCGNCGGWRLQLGSYRVSTVDRHFAAVNVVRGTNASGQPVQPIAVLLWHGTRRWAAIDWGSVSVGCGLVPVKVLRDLKLAARCS
jgi:hypothetical protein